MPRRFKFAGKTCAYCATQTATTADHVFSREFFLVKHRGNLPQAPACHHCNSAKSKLEHYLTAVLPFAGSHADAAENLSNFHGAMTLERIPVTWKRSLHVGSNWCILAG